MALCFFAYIDNLYKVIKQNNTVRVGESQVQAVVCPE